ncbi:MAG: SDR family oxidoreductase [Syntrophobacteraceae bacterium]
MGTESEEFAIITGAGSGIGRALAVALSHDAVTVIAVGRRKALLDETAAIAPGCVRVVPADVAEVPGYSKITDALSTKARIKYLIHAAGICSIERTLEISNESWQQTMATNLDGPLFLTLHLLPWLKKGSRILFIGSNSAATPRKGCAAYCVSKAASHMLQECLKLELCSQGILVGGAIPSPVYTPLLISQLAADPEIFPDALEYRRLSDERKLISPETVARFYHWLLTKVSGDDYCARRWNIQDEAHHSFWLGDEGLFDR